MARVLIADDHAMVRAGVKQFLLEDELITDVGEAVSGRDTLEKLRESRWNLLILDINMPDGNGLDVLKQLRSDHIDTPVLVVSGYPERQYATNILRSGASGYIQKDAPPEDLRQAVRAILGGRRYVSHSMAEQLICDASQDQGAPLHDRLSEREFQIFCKLATGTSVSQIAAELGLSVKTVSTYRGRILSKMNFISNADITTYGLRSGLVQ